MRDYSNLIDRLNKLNLPYKIIGVVTDNPIYLYHLESQKTNPKHILITGGVHGDEPAGIEAVLEFLARDNTCLLRQFSFNIIPCINPYGYVHYKRENSDNVDINRSFEEDDVLEALIVKEALQDKQYTLAIDFHEDYDAHGFYLYEGIRDGEYIGTDIINDVKTIGPIDTDDSGEDTESIAQGVYKVNSKWGMQGLAPYLLHKHSKHVIITETPTVWKLEQRIALHLGVLDSALTYYT